MKEGNDGGSATSILGEDKNRSSPQLSRQPAEAGHANIISANFDSDDIRGLQPADRRVPVFTLV